MARGRGRGKRGGTKPGKLPQYIGNLQGDVGLSPEAAKALDGLYRSQSGPQYIGNLLGDLNLSPGAAAYLEALAKQAAAGKTTTTTGTSKPPVPTSENVPEDSQYRLEREGRRGTLATGLENARMGEDVLASEYGFGLSRFQQDQISPDGRPVAYAGEVSSFSSPDQSNYDADRGFDAANPFSRASKLNEAFTTARKMSNTSYANRGLLNSGAYSRQMYRDANNYSSALSGLRNEFATRLNEFRTQRGQARTDYSTGNLQDKRALLDRALEQWRLNNPSA